MNEKESLKEKLQDRISSLNYIKRLHTRETYWFNVIKVTPDDIESHLNASTIQKRAVRWFQLGYSISPLLEVENGYPFVTTCTQLIEEFNFHFSTITQQSIKILKSITNTSTGIKKNPKTGKVNYVYLRIPKIPLGLSYREVLYSLCDILTFVYRKLMENITENIEEDVKKVDLMLRDQFFGRISKDVNNLAMDRLKKGDGGVLSNLFTKDTKLNDLVQAEKME